MRRSRGWFPRATWPPAYALWQVQLQVGIVIGPALAGLLLAGPGLATVYWLDVGSFVVSVLSVVALHPMPPTGKAIRAGWRSVVEGFRYLRGREVIQGVYLLDINAMVFGMPRALFPALGHRVLSRGGPGCRGPVCRPRGRCSGLSPHHRLGQHRPAQGRAVIIAVIVWGAAIAVFGLVNALWVALILLAVAGWADVVSAVFRNTILQMAVPDELRGRLSAIQIAVVQGGPRLGDLEAGGVAEAFGASFSVVSGGVACVVGAVLLAAALPGFRNQELAGWWPTD